MDLQVLRALNVRHDFEEELVGLEHDVDDYLRVGGALQLSLVLRL